MPDNQWLNGLFYEQSGSGESDWASTDETVYSAALSHFDKLVIAEGGDPETLREALKIESPAAFGHSHALQYAHLIRILHGASRYLACPDLGLKLANIQGGLSSLPLALQLVMKNSYTIGSAYQYCSEHLSAYSSVVDTTVRADRAHSRYVIRFEIRKSWKVPASQAVEHAIGLLHNSLMELSSGGVRSREIWFRHSALSEMPVYRRHFGCDVRLDMPINAVIISNSDYMHKIKYRNNEIYDMADDYVRRKYPSRVVSLVDRIEDVLCCSLDAKDANYAYVARKLGMHHRTLQRRLKVENVTFESIKDKIRKRETVKLLANTNMPISTISQCLGYSEPSVFSRSCYRWFAMSPSCLREHLIARSGEPDLMGASSGTGGH